MYLVIKELKLFMYLEEIPLDKQHLNRDDLQDGYPPPEKKSLQNTLIILCWENVIIHPP